MAICKRDDYDDSDDYEAGRRPYKFPRQSASLRLETINNIGSLNCDMAEEIDQLLEALQYAYATIDCLRRRLSSFEIFGQDCDDDDDDDDDDRDYDDESYDEDDDDDSDIDEPWFIETNSQ
ncbi:hypothetical protein PHYBOEH_000002 [Phytophthora boehmeriae]|uniref:Uncharacterized protein n=1 Tax=Phytophthora boehmeriae TaxID=109152 RepID=A0A8T1XA51_9STRA|nr:hypothetical protein PHYBOEH_000002 [Phytophthora boehmeriae]